MAELHKTSPAEFSRRGVALPMANFPFGELFLLSLFLFPSLKKGIHDFQHKNDFHCTAAKPHFHEEYHFCQICDFISPLAFAPVEPFFNFNIFINSLICAYRANAIHLLTDCWVSLRGPPCFFSFLSAEFL